jgi:hypothetical protein
MAIPTNITATPDNSLAVDLPRPVTITGTDIFERPYSTENEEFTQIAPDVLAADWKNGAAKVDALIGQGVSCTSTNHGVDLSNKIPSDIATTKFLGGSFFLEKKVFESWTYQMILNMGDSGYSRGIWFQYAGGNSLSCLLIDGSVIKQTDIIMPVTPVGTSHFFWYIDLNISGSDLKVYVDGVDSGTPVSSGDVANFPITTGDTLTIMNGNIYDRAVDGTLCDFHLSTDVNFKNELAKYSNLPTIVVV